MLIRKLKEACECRANRSLRQEKHRQTASSTDAETNDLTLGQAKEKLGFDFCQILRYGHIGHMDASLNKNRHEKTLGNFAQRV